MGMMRRVGQWVRPPGRVPVGSPRSQAHYARWWRWYGVAGGLGLVVSTAFSILGNIAGVSVLGGIPLVLLFYSLLGWRITHPPKESVAEYGMTGKCR